MFPLHLPRHACSPRDRVRAGDLWRLVQEATIQDSAARGWPPGRYRDEGSAFVVREMTGVHLREASYGEPLIGFSRVVETRRALLMRREAGIEGVLNAAVEWVHINAEGAPSKAPPALVEAFPVEAATGLVTFPEFEAVEPVELPVLSVRPWWTEMDPMGHVNHPRYLDWAEEALAGWLAARGHDPLGVVPIADRVRFRAAAKAGDEVTVHTALIGRRGDTAVFHARMRRTDEVVSDAWLARTHLDGAGVWT